MAYRPRRRGGIAKEVASFATAFMQGMKLFSDDDRYGRSRARDPYSDENLAKVDSRLGTTSALGRLFGKGEDELTGFDRGRAAIAARREIAVQRGDAPRIKQEDENALLLEKKAAIPPYYTRGSSDATAPARPTAGGGGGSAASAAARPTAGGGDGSAASAAGGDGSAASAAGGGGSSTPTERQPPVDVTRGLPLGTNAPVVRPQSMDEGGGGGDGGSGPTFTNAALDEAEVPPVENAAYTWNPDQGSIFEREATFDSAPDFEMGVSVARGGMIPTMYAARGASVTDRMGSTGGALNMDEVTNPGARYTGGLEYGTAEGELEEGEEPGSPTMYRPEGPAIEDGEAAGRTANLNLSRDPEELARAAVPALTAGVERIQAELKPTSAISAQDPAYQEKLQRFARGEGRMTDEEIAELDRVVDPDGKLAPSAKSAARLAAIYKFYEDRGEPDTARDVAARVILYDKFASQTLGAMAAQALKDGDIDSGVKLLEDAYNKNVPDARSLRADRDDEGLVRINEDGTVSYNFGWDKLTGFQPTQGGRASQQDLIQLADATKRGTVHMDRLLQSVEAGRGGSGRRAATGAVTNKATDEDVTRGLEAVRAAATALKEARTANDAEGVAQANRQLQTAYSALEQLPVPRMRDGRSDENVRTRRMKQAKDAATSITGETGRATARTSGGTAEERAAAAEEAELRRLYGERVAIETGLASSRGIQAGNTQARTPGMSEATAAEIARRSYGAGTPNLYAVDAGVGTRAEAARMANIGAVGALGYKGAEDAPTSKDPEKGSIDAIAAPYLKALEGEEDIKGTRVGGILGRSKKDALGRVDPDAKGPSLTDDERRMFTDIFGRLGKKNTTLSKESMAQVVYDIARPRAEEIKSGERPEVDWKNKTINYKGKSIYVDETSMRDLAAMRGQTVREYFRNEREFAVKTRDKRAKIADDDLKFTERKIAELEGLSRQSSSRTTSRPDRRDAAERRRQEEIRKLQIRRNELLGRVDIYDLNQ